jgi:hypothetical protein
MSVTIGLLLFVVVGASFGKSAFYATESGNMRILIITVKDQPACTVKGMYEHNPMRGSYWPRSNKLRAVIISLVNGKKRPFRSMETRLQ